MTVLPEVVVPGVMDMMATEMFTVAPGSVRKMTLAGVDSVVTAAEPVSSAVLGRGGLRDRGRRDGLGGPAASTGTALPGSRL